VRELEDHLGAPLFARGAGGVELTAVGVRFVEDAERALDHLGRAAEIAGAVGREARQLLRIGAAAIPGSGFLPEALQAIAGARPRCQIRLHEASSADNLAAVRAGALDLAVVLAAPPALAGAEVVPLWWESLLCATPAGERRGSGSGTSWRDIGLDGLILPSGEIGDLIIRRLAERFGGAFPGAACRAGPETAMRLAEMGQGTAVVPVGAAGLAPAGVCLQRVADDGVLVSAVRLVRNEKPALRRLMGLLRELGADALGEGIEDLPTVAAARAPASRQKRGSRQRGGRSSGLLAAERRWKRVGSAGEGRLVAGE
jgi:DNA-binding transcriptional LysR family regulator